MTADEARAKAAQLYEAGVAAFRRGDQDESRQINEQVLKLGEEHDDDESVVRGLIGLSRIAFREGDHAALRALCERAMPLWERLPDRSVVTSPIHMLAESARLEGQLERARDLYEKSIAASREVGNNRFEAVEQLNLSFLELQAGDLEAARARVKASVQASAPGEGDLPYVLLALGAIAARGGDGRRAAEMLAKAEAMLAERGEVFDPGDKPLFDSATADARDVLGESFVEAWEAGSSLSTDEALARALL